MNIMEAKDRKEKYQPYFKEISVGIQKIREAGGCFVITIPKHIIELADLNKGSNVHVLLFKRIKKFHKELADDEQWVKMKKKEKIMFEAWKNQKESDNEWEI